MHVGCRRTLCTSNWLSVVLSFYKWVPIQRPTRLPRAAGEGEIRGGPDQLEGGFQLEPQGLSSVVQNPNQTSVIPYGNSYFSDESVRLSNFLFTFRDSKQENKHGCSLVTKAWTENDVALAVILSHKGIKKERSPPLSTHSGSPLNNLDLFSRINKFHN